MNPFQIRLYGALIGLARATDGNEHLITPDSTAVVTACLAAVPEDETALQALLNLVEDAKRRMVPDCFSCANPCGRTSAYDLNELYKVDAEIRNLKEEILEIIRTLSAGESAGYDPKLLYQGLVAVGMEDYEAQDLVPILQNLKSIAIG